MKYNKIITILKEQNLLKDYIEIDLNINNISYNSNEIKENTLKRPSKKNILEFEEILKDNGIEVTVRREMGTDINAACGQLRRSYLEENK